VHGHHGEQVQALRGHINGTSATTSTRNWRQPVRQPIPITMRVATSPGLVVAASPGMAVAAGWLAGRVSANDHPDGHFPHPCPAQGGVAKRFLKLEVLRIGITIVIPIRRNPGRPQPIEYTWDRFSQRISWRMRKCWPLARSIPTGSRGRELGRGAWSPGVESGLFDCR
jgi:hypothetical protein